MNGKSRLLTLNGHFDSCETLLRVVLVVRQWSVRRRIGKAPVMVIFRRLLTHAAARLTSDPRVRAKAATVFEHEVKPRAAAAWRQTRPKLEAARDELRHIAEKTDPRENPRAFAVKVKERFLDRGKSS